MPVTVRSRSGGTMPNCSKSIVKRLLLFVAASFYIFCVACRAPLQITDIKINECCDMICLFWTTNYEAKCKVTFCDSSQCYVTDLEPEWGFLHSNAIPKGVHSIKLYAEDKDDRTSLLEVK